MILAIAAALAIVVADHTPVRSAPQSGSTQLTTLWQGDVLEIRGERAGYLQGYNYRRERGGYLRSDAVRPLGLTESDAAGLLAVLRFLRESHGSEALGISYGAAYLKAVPAQGLTAEPLEAIALMAERLADTASGTAGAAADVGAHLDVVSQFGIHMRSFERNGRIHVCYDGELFHRVLDMPRASAEERAIAALSLARADCIDPALSPASRTAFDRERSALLAGIPEGELTPLTRSRLHARRATVWGSLAFEEARAAQTAGAAGQAALAELSDLRLQDLGEDRRLEYTDAMVRVGASRWAADAGSRQVGELMLSATSGEPGQICVVLHKSPSGPPLVHRCTYGVPWMASAQVLGAGLAVVLAVQPLESWRELWVFHQKGGVWIADVLPPGFDDPEEGYIEYAGYAAPTRRLLIVRELKDRGRFRRSFEELRLDDLVTVRQASSPGLLRDFGRWQDAAWRRGTLALR